MSVSLDVTLSTLTFGYAGYIQLLAFFEFCNGYHLSYFVSFAFFYSEFGEVLFSNDAGLVEMSGQRFVYSLRLLIVKSLPVLHCIRQSQLS